jgi:hypothetical protein
MGVKPGTERLDDPPAMGLLPNGAPPSKKVTVPVASAGRIWTDNVTDWHSTDGFGVAAKLFRVVATVASTVTILETTIWPFAGST